MLARGRKNEKKGGYGIEMSGKDRDWGWGWDRDRSSEAQNKEAIAILRASLRRIKQVCFGKVKGKTRR